MKCKCDELHLPSKTALVLYNSHATIVKHTHVEYTAETMLIEVIGMNAAVHGEWYLCSAISVVRGVCEAS